MSDNEIRTLIAQAIEENDTILFMKGSPDAPACGFSARSVAMLQQLETPFAAVDVLPDPRIRQELSAISGWPTIPQLFHKGELIGGCDIVTEMYENGELALGRYNGVVALLGGEERRLLHDPRLRITGEARVPLRVR